MQTSDAALEQKAVEWLLGQSHPGVRYLTLRDIVGVSNHDQRMASARNQIASFKPIAELLGEQHSGGYWAEAEDAYWPKWRATVWPLILLAEMGVPGNTPKIQSACEFCMNMASGQDRSWPPPDFPEGDLTGYRLLWEPCVTGNMAWTLVQYGYGEDPRVREMFEWLVKTQLPDGGWNCDIGPWGEKIHHSSFMSTIEPLWAFSALDPSRWPKGGRDAVARGCEFLLMHRLYKSDKDGRVIRDEWTKIHFPLFYFYDILHGLRVLTSLGHGQDSRTTDATDLLRSKRLPDGTWPLESTFVNSLRRNFSKDSTTGQWGEVKGEGIAQIPKIYESLGAVGSPNPWVTLNALRVLRSE